jgi:hypothetical protein
VEEGNGIQNKLLRNRNDYSGLFCEASREPLLGNGFANTHVVKAMAETDTQASENELFGSDVLSGVDEETT